MSVSESLDLAGRGAEIIVSAFDVYTGSFREITRREGIILEGAFAAALKGGAGGLTVLEDPVTRFHRARLVDLAAQSRLPTMYWGRVFAEAGGLMSYTASDHDMDRRAAYYVDRILKGGKPADLPVEQPTKFELVINLKTAQALGLTIPPTLLFQADEVIR